MISEVRESDLKSYFVTFDADAKSKGRVVFDDSGYTAKEQEETWISNRHTTPGGSKYLELADEGRLIAITDDWRFTTYVTEYDINTDDYDGMTDKVKAKFEAILLE